MNKRTNDDLQNITWIQDTSYRQKCQLVVRDELNLHPTIGGVYTIASFLKIIIPYYLYTKYNMKRCNKGSDRGNGHSCFQRKHFPTTAIICFYMQCKRPSLCTETSKRYLVTVIIYYIFHIKPHFFKTIFQSQLLLNFYEFY